MLGTIEEANGPPEATLIRRAQSYSDFHDAVKAVLGKDAAGKEKEKDKGAAKLEDVGIKSELDFADWYHDLEHELLDSSHDDYTLVARPHGGDKSTAEYLQGMSEAIRVVTVPSGLSAVRHVLHAGPLSFLDRLIQRSRSPDYHLSEAMRGSTGRTEKDHWAG